MLQLTGKTALVTGGSRGIGAATVLAMAQAGADVAFTYRSDSTSAGTIVAEVQNHGRRCIPLRADSSDPAAVTRAVEHAASELGRLDILVNNAGTWSYGPFDEVSLAELNHVMALHVTAAFVAVQAAVGHMGSGGRIISIGSSLAERVPAPGMALYAMSKAALLGMTKGLARDLGPRGITVNMVNPGPIDTDMNPASDPAAEAERMHVALGHYGQPADVAGTIVHLASDMGRFITGAAIAVDGGYTA